MTTSLTVWDVPLTNIVANNILKTEEGLLVKFGNIRKLQKKGSASDLITREQNIKLVSG